MVVVMWFLGDWHVGMPIDMVTSVVASFVRRMGGRCIVGIGTFMMRLPEGWLLFLLGGGQHPAGSSFFGCGAAHNWYGNIR